MTDSLYRESVAYHEAGHMVVAAVQGLQLRPYGIRLAGDKGMAYYRQRPPKSHYDGPTDISREHTIIAAFAGLIAQKRFCQDCSEKGADEDSNLIEQLLVDMHAEDTFASIKCSSLSAARLKLEDESKRLVERYWAAIEALAIKALKMPEEPRTYEPNYGWSDLSDQRILDGSAIIETLQGFGIKASIYYDGPVD